MHSSDVLCVNKVRNGVIIQSQMYWLQTETIDKGRGDLNGSGRVWGTSRPRPPDRNTGVWLQ